MSVTSATVAQSRRARDDQIMDRALDGGSPGWNTPTELLVTSAVTDILEHTSRCYFRPRWEMTLGAAAVCVLLVERLEA